MANRFTDSRKWDDPWFRKLPCKYKAFWIFLLDKCNHAGIWKTDFESAEFHIGENIIKEEVLECFADRVKELKGKWFIPKFIEFQYQTAIKNLNPDNRVHYSVINLLKKEGVYKGLIRCLQGRKDKDKDIYKDKDKDKDTIRPPKNKLLDYVYLTDEEKDKLLNLLGIDRANEYIRALNDYVGSKGVSYKSHYHTILSWVNKDEKRDRLTKKPR